MSLCLCVHGHRNALGRFAAAAAQSWHATTDDRDRGLSIKNIGSGRLLSYQ